MRLRLSVRLHALAAAARAPRVTRTWRHHRPGWQSRARRCRRRTGTGRSASGTRVSTSGISWRFMPAIWNSYSKSLTARRPRTTTLPPWPTTKSRSRPRKAITSTFGYLAASSAAISSRSAMREHRALVVAGGHRQDQALEQPAGAAHQVFVAQRHRVEGARVDGGEAGHGGQGALPSAVVRGRSVAARVRLRSRARNRWTCTAPARTCRCSDAGPAAASCSGAERRGRPRGRRSRRARPAAPRRPAPARTARRRTAGREARARSAPARSAPSRPARRRARRARVSAFRRSRDCVQARARASRSRSSSTTSAAPREAASKPSAPLPAKASRQRQPVEVLARAS